MFVIPTNTLINSETFDLSPIALSEPIGKFLRIEGNILYFGTDNLLTEVTFENGSITTLSSTDFNSLSIAVTSKYIYTADDRIRIYEKTSKALLGTLPIGAGYGMAGVYGEYIVEYGVGTEEVFKLTITDAHPPPVSNIFSEYSFDQTLKPGIITGNDSELYILGSGITQISLNESGMVINSQQVSTEQHNSAVLSGDYLVTIKSSTLLIYDTSGGTTFNVVGTLENLNTNIINSANGNYISLNNGIIDISDPTDPTWIFTVDHSRVYDTFLEDQVFYIASFNGFYAYDITLPSTDSPLGQWQVPYSHGNGIYWARPYNGYMVLKDNMDDPRFYTLSPNEDYTFTLSSQNEMGTLYALDLSINNDRLYMIWLH